MQTTRRRFIAMMVGGLGALSGLMSTASWAGTGSCKISGCGCKAFSAAIGPDSPHCIGRNSAGGTCNHLMDEHN